MVLELRDISKTFSGPKGPVPAVAGVSLSIDAGEVVAVVGPSGCGKSTLLLVSGGLLRPDQGVVSVTGRDVYSLGAGARASLRASSIGFVFQQFHLIPYLSIVDNVRVPYMAGGATASSSAVDALLSRFGLTDRADHLPGQLSAGEQQRVALARAMIRKPGLILADEPTGNLDSGNAEAVLKGLSDFAASGGAVLLVTHDDRARPFSNRWYRIESGKITGASSLDKGHGR